MLVLHRPVAFLQLGTDYVEVITVPFFTGWCKVSRLSPLDVVQPHAKAVLDFHSRGVCAMHVAALRAAQLKPFERAIEFPPGKAYCVGSDAYFLPLDVVQVRVDLGIKDCR